MAENAVNLGFIQVLSVVFRLEKAQKLVWSILHDQGASLELASTAEQATQTQQAWSRPISNMCVLASWTDLSLSIRLLKAGSRFSSR